MSYFSPEEYITGNQSATLQWTSSCFARQKALTSSTTIYYCPYFSYEEYITDNQSAANIMNALDYLAMKLILVLQDRRH